ncbi:uncharacterized protein LOC111042260 [Myzus persicae]|uniref:uncharacterized protein LOC111042260 n=1 Tax=Myzus persicae TaxID=13164 RepID=UPI000B931D1F|nr:uncharacterized protein LOC111042260 [Myzus persicae]
MEELEIGTGNMEELKCLVCNKYFSYKRTLKRHSITCGSKESKNINSVQCPDLSCHKLFTNKKMLKCHIESDHGVRLLNEQKTFATLHGKCDLLNIHRRNCGINTNMYLESVHKCLKYYYLHGKKNKRLDTCINALLKFTRNTIFERFIKLVKNKYTAKEENIIKSHNIGVQINPETIKVIDDNRWEISAKKTNMAYEVIHTIDVCNTEDCRLVCRMCNICIHNYTCECKKKILIPAAEINLIEKSIVKTNTDKEHEQLIQIKNQLEAGIGVLSSLIASKSEVTEVLSL